MNDTTDRHRPASILPLVLVLALTLAAPLAAGTTPPETMHYQGVLRGADGAPLDGSYDMVFRYYDDLGSELLVEEHLAAGSGAVVVTSGLFGVALGSGVRSDGSGNGYWTQISQMFRDNASVEMEIEVEGETLSPRIPIHAAPFAHNTKYFGGSPETDFLKSTSEPQVKAGDLEVEGNLIAGGNLVSFGSGDTMSSDPFGGLTFDHNGFGTMTLGAGGLFLSGSLHLSGDTGQSVYWNSLNGFNFTDRARVQRRLTVRDPVNDINDSSPEIYFESLDSTHVLSWQGFFGQFRLTDDLYVFGDLFGDALHVGGGTLDHGTGQFTLDDDLTVDGALQVGNGPASAPAYNRFGSGGGPDSGDITTADDLFVLRDLELDETLYLNGDLRMSDVYQPFQHIYFHNGSTQTGDYLRFAQAADEFEFSNVIQGPVSNNFWIKADSNLRFMFDDDNSTTGNVAEWFHDGAFDNVHKVAEIQEGGGMRIRGTLSQNVAFDVAESFWASEPLEPGELVAADPDRPGAVRRAARGIDRAVLGVVSGHPGVLLGSAPFDPAALRESWGEEIHDLFQRDRTSWEAIARQRHPELNLEASTVIDPATPGESELSDRDPERRRLENREALEARALEVFHDTNFVAVALAGRVPVRVDATYGAIAVGDPLSPSPTPGVAMRADGASPAIAIALEPLDDGQGMVLGFIARFETVAGKIETLAREVDRRTPDPLTGVQTMNGDLRIVLDRSASDDARFMIVNDGGMDGELGDELLRVDEAGNLSLRGSLRPHSMDVAEYFPVLGPVSAGDVLAIDPGQPGVYRRTSSVADSAVVGVVAANPGVLLGGSAQRIAAVDVELAADLDRARAAGDRDEEDRIWSELERRFLETHAPVALTGTVDLNVDAGYGAVRPGDLLVSSPTPGHAMRTDDPRPGTIVGKALTGLAAGTGTVRVLVMLR